MTGVIRVENLTKRYRKYHPGRPMTVVELLARGFRSLKPARTFTALEEISFTVDSGRMLGIVGANGAGKSTLLRLLGGVGRPDGGAVAVDGRIGALLDLGEGFHPDLTGRENIFISGVISGLTRREVAERFDDMVAFAALEPFIDNPLRTYSSGMQMRLAFAVAIHIEPEILLIDELLAVGDIAFQRKCLDRIGQFKARGCTIVLVSHDPGLVRELCDEAIWLRDGRIAAQGAAEWVVGQYVAEMEAETRRRTPASYPPRESGAGASLTLNENRFGSLEMEIRTVQLLNMVGEPTMIIASGDPLTIRIAYRASRPIPCPIFGVTLTTEDGFICYETSTAAAGLELTAVAGDGALTLHLARLDLQGDCYFLDVGIYEQNWRYAYDYHWRAYRLCVESPGGEKGVLRPPGEWVVDSG